MRIEQSIREKLLAAFVPAHLEVHNDSHGHNVPKGSESHFRVVIVSEAFAGQGRVARQREVNRVLAEELAGGVHALQMETWTPAQWAERGGMTVGPPECRGGMAAERRMQAEREGEEG